MAMTAAVKDEISRLPVTRTCCRKSEVSSILRFAGGLHLVSGRIVIEAELDTGIAARRLRKDILEIFGHSSDLVVMAPGGLRRGSRYVGLRPLLDRVRRIPLPDDGTRVRIAD
ncbi:DNA-binding protein WhiA, partial [Streptomyces lydicus]|uniref:DNA-binding protein WhiA n=1 Tax=Streptomyces lydicus TaxID=47763 RepID=UPI0033211488